MIYYCERKLLSGMDVSEKAGKVSRTTKALDVRRKQRKGFCKERKNMFQANSRISWYIFGHMPMDTDYGS
ncbi:hypothetical protein TNCV_997141 [Trichonephila clavipes]|uniref:Uncharacterized protein n=1 Tax=Trichonephila clavipes TaxID=2585209 RepID=A0A8X6WFK5_TRICX|nr:hypothetical protein TNCV_997141 [Trichonephila clavipes]